MFFRILTAKDEYWKKHSSSGHDAATPDRPHCLSLKNCEFAVLN